MGSLGKGCRIEVFASFSGLLMAVSQSRKNKKIYRLVSITQGAVEVPGDQKISSSKQTLSTTKPIAKAVSLEYAKH